MDNKKKQRYLLDTNVLITRPGLLARSDAAERFLIPLAAINQLSDRGHGTSVGPLHRVLAAAANTGVEVIESPKTLHSILLTLPESRLDSYDLSILGALLELQSDPTQKVCLVTLDKALLKAANQIGLEAISLDELQQSLEEIHTTTAPSINLEVKEQVETYEKSERSRIQSAIVVGFIAISIVVAVYFNYKQIFALIPPFQLASYQIIFIGLVALLSGMILYAFRQRRRTSYGMVESLIGAWIACNAFPLNTSLDVASGLQVIGGLYVVVRGLDNIGTGLKGTRYGPNWQRIFG